MCDWKEGLERRFRVAFVFVKECDSGSPPTEMGWSRPSRSSTWRLFLSVIRCLQGSANRGQISNGNCWLVMDRMVVGFHPAFDYAITGTYGQYD